MNTHAYISQNLLMQIVTKKLQNCKISFPIIINFFLEFGVAFREARLKKKNKGFLFRFRNRRF